MPYLCLWRRNFCAAGGVLFSYSGAIFERSKPLSIEYSGAKYTRFPPKIAAMQKSLFRMVENSKFLKRLRNGYLEKSVATGICRVQRSPKTAKTPAKVHLRLRFQNPGKPRTAGLSGRAAGACDCGPLSVLKSNGLRHPKNLPVKFGFSSKSVPANIAKKLPPQCCSKPLLIPFFNFSHKRPTFAFTGESGYTLGFRRRITHSGLHAETGGLPALGHSAVLCRQRNSFYSTTLLYTYISRFSVNPHYQQREKSGETAAINFIPNRFSTSLTNGPRLPSPPKAGTHSLFGKRSHTRAHTAKQGPSERGRYHYPRHELHVHEHPRAGCQNGVLCRFWVLAGCTPEERREPSEQRCAYARRCSEASRPRWAA